MKKNRKVLLACAALMAGLVPVLPSSASAGIVARVTVKSVVDSRCLDGAPSARLCSGKIEQQWDMDLATNGPAEGFRLQNVRSGRCLTAVGAVVRPAACDVNDIDQLWVDVQGEGNGVFVFNLGLGGCLQRQAGRAVALRPCQFSLVDEQRWFVDSVV
jgi:hypothetical protein